MLPEYKPRMAQPDSPSFRGFDAYRYDLAKISAQLEQLIAVTCQADTSGIRAAVPIPAVEKLYRERGLARLRSTVAKAVGLTRTE